jgi:hypothetical protein
MSRDFRLPSVANVAGTLAKRPSAPPAEEERPPHTELVDEPIKPTKPTKLPSAAGRRGGRPKGAPSRRMHVAIEESLASYLDRAWRNHERADGSLAGGPADLIEDLLAEHRDRRKRKIS